MNVLKSRDRERGMKTGSDEYDQNSITREIVRSDVKCLLF